MVLLPIELAGERIEADLDLTLVAISWLTLTIAVACALALAMLLALPAESSPTRRRWLTFGWLAGVATCAATGIPVGLWFLALIAAASLPLLTLVARRMLVPLVRE